MCVSKCKNLLCFQKQRYLKKTDFYVFYSISSTHYNIFVFLTSHFQRLNFNQTFHVLVLESQEVAAILNSTNINKTHSTMGMNVFCLLGIPKYSTRDFWHKIGVSCESTYSDVQQNNTQTLQVILNQLRPSSKPLNRNEIEHACKAPCFALQQP